MSYTLRLPDIYYYMPGLSVANVLCIQVLLKKMFGPDVGDQGLADMLHKIESLFQER